MPFSVTAMFTLVQLFCLGTVYGITRTPKAAMAFPIFILLLVPLRFLILPYFFSAEHLKLLDGDDDGTPHNEVAQPSANESNHQLPEDKGDL